MSNLIQTKRHKEKEKEGYEHISLAVTGRPVLNDEQIVPRPTVTLLRDFDPCFDDLEEEDDADDGQEVDELYDQIDEITVRQEVNDEPVPKVKPRTKFPVGSPKKINFGPPKPPRNFYYNSTKEDEEPKTKESKVSPKSLKTMFSESNLVKAMKKCEAERTVEEPSELCKKQPEQVVAENIYVTVSAPTQPDTPPPPLPSSRPPPARTERPVTMYENVWVEPQCLPPLPPRAPAEASHTATKTGKLEEIFFSKKMSQESLVSHNSSAGGTFTRDISTATSHTSTIKTLPAWSD